MSEIREDIVTAYVTRLGTIATGSGYRYTVDTVERGYRDPSDVGSSERPYIGVYAGSRESYKDTSGGLVEVEMQIILSCYLTASAATQAAVIAALSGFTSDVRKALYTSPQNLSVPGLIFVRVVSRMGTEGLVEAAKTKNAAMQIETIAKFQESSTA